MPEVEVSGLLYLCILLPLLARFLPDVCILLWLRLKGRIQVADDLRLEIADLKQQQLEISMVDEFAKHAKLSRRINAKKSTLKSIEQEQMWIKLKAFWSAKVLLYLCSVVLVLLYRAQAVVVMDIAEYLDYNVIYVTAYILAFPTGKPGVIGLPIGMFVLNRLVNKFCDMFCARSGPTEPISDPVD